jgi:hypothetical protein
MLVKFWRLGTIMFTALSMGVALCHLLEMPAKITFDGAVWLTLLQTLYPPAFGTVVAFFEVGAVVTGSGARIPGPPAPASVCLDRFGSSLPSGNSRSLLGLGRSGERHDGAFNPRNSAGKLDAAARPMGIHARRARDSSDYCARGPRVLNTR